VAGAGIHAERTALDARATRQDRGQLDVDLGRVSAELAQGHGGDAVRVIEQRGEDVFRIEDGAGLVGGQLLGGEDCLLRLLRESVELHTPLTMPS
jgi:hypothetical protein